MRTFIAIDLPPEVKKNIAELMGELKQIDAPIKWVEPQNLHITLKFLGELGEEKIENLTNLIKQSVSDITSFSARFKGMGIFPKEKRPKIIWVGTGQGAQELCELAAVIEKNLSHAGYPKEEREFKPHITIGRVKDWEQKKGADVLKEKISVLRDSKFGDGIVDRILIMKSTLTPNGPIYEKIKEVLL